MALPLLRRTLLYHWRTNAAVLFGVMIATAVLAGALVVGDAVRGSLRRLTLERLGRIDHALVGRFVREQLADELSRAAAGQGFERVAPAILSRGTVVRIDAQGRESAVAGSVNVIGVDERFWEMFADREAERLKDQEKLEGRHALLNATLASELGAHEGDRVLLRLERPSAAPRDSLLGRRDDVIATLNLSVQSVVASEGAGRFGLQANQQLPHNIFVPLEDLQRSLGRAGLVNALLVADSKDQRGLRLSAAEDRVAELNASLQSVWQLEDLRLRLSRHGEPGYLSLESEQMLLEPAVAETALAVARQEELPAAETLTYLANSITLGNREIPYSTVSALDPWAEAPLGGFNVTPESTEPLRDAADLHGEYEGEILLSRWAADDLHATPGDTVRLAYYEVGSRGELIEVEKPFLLRGIVPMQGPATDTGLTPEYKGITDVTDLSQWDPPFPFDITRVRRTPPNDQDEAYWDQYRAAPKAFVGLETGKRLWGSRFGQLTSIRLAPKPGHELDAAAREFERQLLRALKPEQLGMTFQPVKAQGLAAVSGSADFGMLFLGFSFFLIGSAAMLVGLLFRLGVEQRSSEIGILLASGFTPGRVRRLLLAEGAVVAGVGALVGLGAAVGYAALMLAGLRSPSWWLAAVQTPFIHLHLQDSVLSLIVGYAASVMVALIAITVVVARLGRIAVRYLLSGNLTPESQRGRVAGRARVSGVVAVVGLAAAAGLIVAGIVRAIPAQAAFFGSGGLLLVGGLAVLRNRLAASPATALHGGGAVAVASLGARNGARHPGRSLLVAALVASATFLIVAVAANRRDPTAEQPEFHSGNGGFALLGRSSVPLVYDANAGRRNLVNWMLAGGGKEAPELPGMSNQQAREAAAQLVGVSVFPFRYQPSNDASCLNLYVPQKPPLLGAPQQFLQRTDAQGGGAFRVASTWGQADPTPQEQLDPWLLLEKKLDDGAIPVIGDMNTLMWTFHKGVGDDWEITDDRGEAIRLRIVGMLQDSIFQSELLMSEENMLRHFPAAGYSFFLAEVPAAEAGGQQRSNGVLQLLESHLVDYGFDGKRTSQQLKEYLAVQNTYLSTFQALGGLGLLLGTLGLGAVLFRNVLQRRGELALMRALGFRRAVLAWLVLAENGFLLVVGLVIGTGSALLAVAPHAVSAGADVPWTSLAATLGLVFVAGIASGVVAVAAALRTPLLPALRSE